MIVGVMASGKNEPLDDEERRLAEEVGSTVAELGFHLLTGGGGGLMKIVGQAFLDKKREILNQNRPAGNLISILRAKELPVPSDQNCEGPWKFEPKPFRSFFRNRH